MEAQKAVELLSNGETLSPSASPMMNAQQAVALLRQRLREALTRKDRSVLVVAGSGVSIQATENAPAASWGGLLRLGLERCRLEVLRWRKKQFDSRAIEDKLTSGRVEDWIAAASVIESTLRHAGGSVYQDWLRETVGALRPTNPEILEALGLLGVPVATTNYDGLLEYALALQPMTWRTHDLVDQLLEGTYPGDAVLHLHGHYSEPQSVVLGSSSYAKVLGDKRAQDTLRHLMRSRDLIFVGMGGGLDDPNFGALLDWARDVILPSKRFHFLLVRAKDAPEMRARLTATTRIHVVEYGQEYAELVPFLRSLVGVPPTEEAPNWLADPGSGSVPVSRNLVRRALFELLRTDADFDAFCADEFDDTYRLFSSGMDRQQKATLLLVREGAAQVLVRLRAWCKISTHPTTSQPFPPYASPGAEREYQGQEVSHTRPVVAVQFQAGRMGISLTGWFRKVPIIIRIGTMVMVMIGGIAVAFYLLKDNPTIVILDNPRPTLLGKQVARSIGFNPAPYRCPDPSMIEDMAKKDHGLLRLNWLGDEPIRFIASQGKARAIVVIRETTDSMQCQPLIELTFSSGSVTEQTALKDALREALRQRMTPP